MGKKTEKLRRVVQKLAQRYGEDDESVRRLQAELTVLESLEVARPERRLYKPADLNFQTPAKRLFFAPSEDVHH